MDPKKYGVRREAVVIPTCIAANKSSRDSILDAARRAPWFNFCMAAPSAAAAWRPLLLLRPERVDLVEAGRDL